jgi:hypothetical protein
MWSLCYLFFLSRIGPCGLFQVRINFRKCKSIKTFLQGSFHGASVRRNVRIYIAQHNTGKRGYIHASSGIRTHVPSFRVIQDIRVLDRATSRVDFH